MNRSVAVAAIAWALLGCACKPPSDATPPGPTAEAHYEHGVELRGEGRRREAVAVWETGLRIDPDHAPTQIALAGSLITLHEHGRAAALLDAAKTKRPSDPLLWLEQGRLNIELHEYEDAVAAFGRALELDAMLHSARIGRLEAYAALGQCEEARADFEALRRIRAVGFALRADRLVKGCK